ncbi:MAG: hypothetical protein ACYDCN_07195 [Bacteroidia bacterium]
MKTIKTIIVALILNSAFLIFNSPQAEAQTKEVAYTLADRDRMIRVEEQLKSLQTQMDVRFAAMDTKFAAMDTKFAAMDDKIDKLYTLIYFILGGVFGLIGFIMWDRRSYIKPVKEDITGLQQALKEYAKKQPELADILRAHGIL